MKKEKLIEELQKLPEGVNVVVFDWRKCLNNDSGDGSSAGIYSEFEIAMLTKENVPDNIKPFSTLSIANDDYDNDGRLLVGE